MTVLPNERTKGPGKVVVVGLGVVGCNVAYSFVNKASADDTGRPIIIAATSTTPPLHKIHPGGMSLNPPVHGMMVPTTAALAVFDSW